MELDGNARMDAESGPSVILPANDGFTVVGRESKKRKEISSYSPSMAVPNKSFKKAVEAKAPRSKSQKQTEICEVAGKMAAMFPNHFNQKDRTAVCNVLSSLHGGMTARAVPAQVTNANAVKAGTDKKVAPPKRNIIVKVATQESPYKDMPGLATLVDSVKKAVSAVKADNSDVNQTLVKDARAALSIAKEAYKATDSFKAITARNDALSKKKKE